MKLILVRHGETVENIKGIHQGHMDGTLSKLGIEQAKKLALRLKDEKIDVIYSSDLGRSRDTTKEIMKYHQEVPVHFVKGLRECDCGSITGTTAVVDWENRPKDIETRGSMRKRVKKLLDDVYKEHSNDIVLFVGHGGVNSALITIILNKPEEDISKMKQANTAVNIFEIKEDKKHKVHLMNCTKHLKG